ITGQQFNVSICVRHKPVLKPVLEPFCLCRLSGRKWGQFTDGTLDFLRGIGGDAGGGGPVEFCRCTGLFLTRRQGGNAFDTVIRMKMRLDQAFVT
ncbi:hypothetical protein B5M44_09530, partial [Shinella sumterensis]|uniref:hypothetical protein n=1 Tax=Shinella sumterensis TaxID=1967501 RepID=UPI001100B0FC